MSSMIPVDQIGYDPRYYPRVNGIEDWLTVHRYTDALKASPLKEFPPVVVVRVHGRAYAYLLLDGLHRTKSYYNAGRETIPAVVERLPQSKWFARSVEMNASHGRTLDTGDKAWAAVRLEEDGYTIEQAAELLQMRVESLEKIKAEHVVKIKAKAAKSIPSGRGNREVGGGHMGFLKAPFTDFAGTATASGVLAVQESVAARTALSVLDSCIAVLECGIDLSDEKVRGRAERLKELVEKLS